MAWKTRLICMGLFAVLAAPPAWAEPVKYKFAAKRDPSAQVPSANGTYAKGCLAGGVELPETGPGWQAMRLSRNRNFGHPDMIAYIERLSVKAQQIGWPRIYVGDISQPRGGPMRSGHRSHQIGLDADIWLRRPVERLLTRAEREKISSHIVVARGGRDVNKFWTRSHHQVLKAAASDPAVARIFVNPAIKQELCWAEPQGPERIWLRKIRAWVGHNAHFHVRLNCPAGQPGCVEQAPMPEGDGCGEELSWWFQPPDPTKPAPKKKPRKELTLADLPLACSAVLAQ
ncbi:MAG: penicillin-insensitive murein endopeptidase [Pseudomonadota bacterium]